MAFLNKSGTNILRISKIQRGIILHISEGNNAMCAGVTKVLLTHDVDGNDIISKHEIVLAPTLNVSKDVYDEGGIVLLSNNTKDDEIEDKERAYNIFCCLYKNVDKLSIECESMCDNKIKILGINPLLAIELMESAIEKNLIGMLQDVKEIHRYKNLRLEDKINSTFTFIGIGSDDIPFILDVANVTEVELEVDSSEDVGDNCNTRSNLIAYYPSKNENDINIKRINDLTTICKESNIKCIIGYVIETDGVNYLDLNRNNKEYHEAIKSAVENEVLIATLMVKWDINGYSKFDTDRVPVVRP